MKLKLAVATLLTALLIALPFEISFSAYEWRYDPANYPSVVSWAGCTAALDVNDSDSPAGSYYIPGYHILHIGTKDDPAIPYYAGLMILLHEAGHCLQFQADPENQIRGYRENPVAYELDADRRAADLACGLGLDGRSLLRQTFQWAHDMFGYNGDEGHGTLAERMSQADKATMCDKRIES